MPAQSVRTTNPSPPSDNLEACTQNQHPLALPPLATHPGFSHPLSDFVGSTILPQWRTDTHCDAASELNVERIIRRFVLGLSINSPAMDEDLEKKAFEAFLLDSASMLKSPLPEHYAQYANTLVLRLLRTPRKLIDETLESLYKVDKAACFSLTHALNILYPRLRERGLTNIDPEPIETPTEDRVARRIHPWLEEFERESLLPLVRAGQLHKYVSKNILRHLRTVIPLFVQNGKQDAEAVNIEVALAPRLASISVSEVVAIIAEVADGKLNMEQQYRSSIKKFIKWLKEKGRCEVDIDLMGKPRKAKSSSATRTSSRPRKKPYITPTTPSLDPDAPPFLQHWVGHVEMLCKPKADGGIALETSEANKYYIQPLFRLVQLAATSAKVADVEICKENQEKRNLLIQTILFNDSYLLLDSFLAQEAILYGTSHAKKIRSVLSEAFLPWAIQTQGATIDRQRFTFCAPLDSPWLPEWRMFCDFLFMSKNASGSERGLRIATYHQEAIHALWNRTWKERSRLEARQTEEKIDMRDSAAPAYMRRLLFDDPATSFPLVAAALDINPHTSLARPSSYRIFFEWAQSNERTDFDPMLFAFTRHLSCPNVPAFHTWCRDLYQEVKETIPDEKRRQLTRKITRREAVARLCEYMWDTFCKNRDPELPPLTLEEQKLQMHSLLFDAPWTRVEGFLSQTLQSQGEDTTQVFRRAIYHEFYPTCLAAHHCTFDPSKDFYPGSSTSNDSEIQRKWQEEVCTWMTQRKYHCGQAQRDVYLLNAVYTYIEKHRLVFNGDSAQTLDQIFALQAPQIIHAFLLELENKNGSRVKDEAAYILYHSFAPWAAKKCSLKFTDLKPDTIARRQTYPSFVEIEQWRSELFTSDRKATQSEKFFIEEIERAVEASDLFLSWVWDKRDKQGASQASEPGRYLFQLAFVDYPDKVEEFLKHLGEKRGTEAVPNFRRALRNWVFKWFQTKRYTDLEPEYDELIRKEAADCAVPFTPLRLAWERDQYRQTERLLNDETELAKRTNDAIWSEAVANRKKLPALLQFVWDFRDTLGFTPLNEKTEPKANQGAQLTKYICSDFEWIRYAYCWRLTQIGTARESEKMYHWLQNKFIPWAQDRGFLEGEQPSFETHLRHAIPTGVPLSRLHFEWTLEFRKRVCDPPVRGESISMSAALIYSHVVSQVWENLWNHGDNSLRTEQDLILKPTSASLQETDRTIHTLIFNNVGQRINDAIAELNHSERARNIMQLWFYNILVPRGYPKVDLSIPVFTLQEPILEAEIDEPMALVLTEIGTTLEPVSDSEMAEVESETPSTEPEDSQPEADLDELTGPSDRELSDEIFALDDEEEGLAPDEYADIELPIQKIPKKKRPSKQKSKSVVVRAARESLDTKSKEELEIDWPIHLRSEWKFPVDLDRSEMCLTNLREIRVLYLRNSAMEALMGRGKAIDNEFLSFDEVCALRTCHINFEEKSVSVPQVDGTTRITKPPVEIFEALAQYEQAVQAVPYFSKMRGKNGTQSPFFMAADGMQFIHDDNIKIKSRSLAKVLTARGKLLTHIVRFCNGSIAELIDIRGPAKLDRSASKLYLLTPANQKIEFVINDKDFLEIAYTMNQLLSLADPIPTRWSQPNGNKYFFPSVAGDKLTPEDDIDYANAGASAMQGALEQPPPPKPQILHVETEPTRNDSATKSTDTAVRDPSLFPIYYHPKSRFILDPKIILPKLFSGEGGVQEILDFQDSLFSSLLGTSEITGVLTLPQIYALRRIDVLKVRRGVLRSTLPNGLKEDRSVSPELMEQFGEFERLVERSEALKRWWGEMHLTYPYFFSLKHTVIVPPYSYSTSDEKSPNFANQLALLKARDYCMQGLIQSKAATYGKLLRLQLPILIESDTQINFRSFGGDSIKFKVNAELMTAIMDYYKKAHPTLNVRKQGEDARFFQI